MPVAVRLVLLLAVGIATLVVGRRKQKDGLVFAGGALTALTGSAFIAFTAVTIL